MLKQEVRNLDPSLCLECMKQPIEYKRMGEYVVPVCMNNVDAALEPEFAAMSAEAIRQRAEVLRQREPNETPVKLRLVEDQ